MIRGVLIDLSGVLYVGKQALPGAREALETLQSAGIPVRFITNTTRSTRAEILAQLHGFGFSIKPSNLLTAPDITHTYLESNKLTVYPLIHPNLLPEFEDRISETPNAVLIGDAGEDFTYGRLNAAFRLLMEGAPLIAMGNNRYFKEADGLSLDAGPFVAALEYASKRQAVVTGKPAAIFYHTACSSMHCTPRETIMIGDDVEADVLGALDAGLQAILVQTGKFRPEDTAQIEGTDAHVLADFSAAVEWILQQPRGDQISKNPRDD